MQAFIGAWRAIFEGNVRKSVDAAERCIQHNLDPEGVFYMGLIIAHQGQSERALSVLSESIDRGFTAAHVLLRNPWFNSLRSTAPFTEFIRRSQEGMVCANDIYRAGLGTQVLVRQNSNARQTNDIMQPNSSVR
jgi:hypothetical protein